MCPGQTRDLPGSDAFPLCVMGSSTTTERRRLACGAAHVAFDGWKVSASATLRFRGSIATPHDRCVRFAAAVADERTQHSLPGGRYPLPAPDFHRLEPPASLAHLTLIVAHHVWRDDQDEVRQGSWRDPAGESPARVRGSTRREGAFRRLSATAAAKRTQRSSGVGIEPRKD